MISYGISSDGIDALFGATLANTQANFDNLSSTVLGQGIDFFQAGKYDQAINAFRRSAALSPFSDNAAKSYDYIGQAYLRQDNTDQAVKTYQEAIRIYPNRPEFHRALGDIYMRQENSEDALKAYETAVKFDGEDAEARYSLGQAYLTAGETLKAKEQFSKVVQLTPTSAAGYYGLGQAARASGEMDEAVTQLTRAIRVNRNFEIAYIELGSAYADMGDFQKAQDQLAILTVKNSDKATELQNYIAQAAQPQMLTATSAGGFNAGLGPQTDVADLSSTLETAGNAKLFSMSFAFTKDMDEGSITDPYNWKISRATIRDNGGVYNYGLTPSSKEAVILPKPAYVTYNTETNTATVYFWISQNATADATIDPEHIVFKFSGTDAYGKAMDPSADEYSGFRGIA